MKHIPSHITVDLDDKDFFQHVDCFFNLFNLREDNIMCGCTHNITMFKIDKNNIRSPWQLSGENNPWYKHYKYTEKEKNEIITLKKEFDAEKEYMHGMLSNNLIPYENIMTPYTTLTITKDSKVIRDINTTKTYPDVNTHIVYSERNKDNIYDGKYYHPGIDWSELFLGPIKQQEVYQQIIDPKIYPELD